MNTEELFYICLDRIDDDAEVAESFLVGCITHLKASFYGRCERGRVERNLTDMVLDSYTRELKLISEMKDDSLASLIASSVDLTTILQKITIIYDIIDNATIGEADGYTHAVKADKASKLLAKISKKMRTLRKPKKDINSLFGGEDG